MRPTHHRHRRPLSLERLESRVLLTNHPLTDVPALHSDAGSSKSLYLDFDGYHDVFSIDNDKTTFSDAELTMMQGIWQRVAEDYAPFDIDVTTVEPPSFADGVAIRIAIGGSSFEGEDGRAGQAAVGSFFNSEDNVGYVFSDDIFNSGHINARDVAGTASHEAGHAFGLVHQSLYDSAGNLVDEYHPGVGDKEPLMGSGVTPRDIWWFGTSSRSSTSFQDDMAYLANQLGYRADDHGGSAAAAASLTLVADPADSTKQLLRGTGIVGQMSDLDFFAFTVGGANGEVTRFSADINPLEFGPNLDARLEIRNAQGAVVASADPTGPLSAHLTADLTPGQYYMVAASHGDYGDVGQYTLELRDVTGPRVVSAVPSRQDIRLTFNEPMNPDSFGVNDFQLTDAAGQPLTGFGMEDIAPVGTDNRTWTIRVDSFPVGGYRIVVGPELTDVFGNLMDQDRDGQNGERQFLGGPYVPDDKYDLSYFDSQGPQVLSMELADRTVRLHFNEPIDPATFTLADVVEFTDPARVNFKSHLQSVMPVSGTGNQDWDIRVDTFPTGGFRMTVGPNVLDIFANPMNQDGLSPNGEATDDQYHVEPTDLDPPTLLETALSMPGPIGPWGTGASVRGNYIFVAFDESMDVNSFQPSDVALVGPSGNAIPTANITISTYDGIGFNVVPGLHSRNFLISFVPDRALPWGRYTLRIGPNVEDLFHNRMDQNDANNIGGDPADVFAWDFDREPTTLERSFGFADELAAKFEAFPERWIPKPHDPGDPPPDGPDYAVAKSLLVHTVLDAGRPGPDGDFGWGFENVGAGLRFLKDYFGEHPSRMVQERKWSGKEQTWQVFVDGKSPWRATLGWNDPLANEGKISHDLDLWVTGPNGMRYDPWSIDSKGLPRQKGGNHADDVEQVEIASPTRGVYTIHVGMTGKSFTQDFSLIADAAPYTQVKGLPTAVHGRERVKGQHTSHRSGQDVAAVDHVFRQLGTHAWHESEPRAPRRGRRIGS